MACRKKIQQDQHQTTQAQVIILSDTLQEDKGHFKRSVSTSRIKFSTPVACPLGKSKLSKCITSGNPRRYKTKWELLHHLSRDHKADPAFQKEFHTIRRMVK